ncbi:MAG: hypothetical protein ISR90_01805 [Candidatus Marinimicrobia bacterium]|nr:hypothetical protein [Candidatus Neomarinimicrobiota bacterium]MBL7022778.1 hypothetical protein [Candidatus Neomarinimicrobiota bacterium]MBL7109480.1 hypothetical protein [Candidatus Neomarinimicrobiota bacterium]
MSDFIDAIIGLMRKILWFAIFVIVMILSTFKNIISIDVISDYGLDQYWRNIYQFQVLDTYYKVKTPTKVYTDPVLISNLNSAEYQFYLKPGNVFSATGFYEPSNNICWIAIEVYDGETPVHGYVMEPSGCLGFFGAYINKDDRLEQFLGYEEDKYKDSLMNEFFSELTRNFSIFTAESNYKKELLEETGNYENISGFIEDFSGYNKILSSEIVYYCKNTDYTSIKVLRKKYFGSWNYIKRLTHI